MLPRRNFFLALPIISWKGRLHHVLRKSSHKNGTHCSWLRSSVQSSSTLKEGTGQHNVCKRIQCCLHRVNSQRSWSSGVHMLSGGWRFVDRLLNWHPAEETAVGQTEDVKAAPTVPLQMCSTVTWTKVYHYRHLLAGSASMVSKYHSPILRTLFEASEEVWGGASSSAVCAHFNVLNLLLNSEHWSVTLVCVSLCHIHHSLTARASPVVWRSCFWINQGGELAGN